MVCGILIPGIVKGNLTLGSHHESVFGRLTRNFNILFVIVIIHCDAHNVLVTFFDLVISIFCRSDIEGGIRLRGSQGFDQYPPVLRIQDLPGITGNCLILILYFYREIKVGLAVCVAGRFSVKFRSLL